MFDSTMMTKDLSTGVHVSSTGQSFSLGEDGTSIEDVSSFNFIDILYNTHSDIPPPDEGRVFSMTLNIRPTRHSTTSILHPVPESMNQYSILLVEDTNKFSLDDAGCQSPPKPTKRLASSSS